MLTPNKTITKALMSYDRNLSVKWNNKEKYWEVYYRRPWGNLLVTPVVESIYQSRGKCNKFTPLDSRILDWIKSADTKRCSRWRWINRKRFDERKEKESKKLKQIFANIAKDNYSLVNNELINPMVDNTGWLKPDLVSSQGRRDCCRSGGNAKEFFGANS